MIVLFTDFGADDPYVAQVKAVLVEQAPSVSVLDLLHRAPDFRIEAGAHLLSALQDQFPPGAVFMAIVDPTVGTDRDAVVVEADGKWYVGPDNGLLSVVAARAKKRRMWRIVWRPQRLSASFHGRDLFAPVVAAIARGDPPLDRMHTIADLAIALGENDLAEVIYIDHYGNALTGLRARNVPRAALLGVRGRRLRYARTFAEADASQPFWYENSIGLVEIAANRASAAAVLAIEIGDRLDLV